MVPYIKQTCSQNYLSCFKLILGTIHTFLGTETVLHKYNEEFHTDIVICDDIDSQENIKETDTIIPYPDLVDDVENVTKDSQEENNIEMIEVEEFDKEQKEMVNKIKKMPLKRINKNKKCQDCNINHEKILNMERVINQLDKELNYWVTTYNEDKTQSEMQIKNIMKEIINPLIDENAKLVETMNELKCKVEERDQMTKDRLVQQKKELRTNKEEIINEINDINLDITKLKNENKNTVKEQLKIHQNINELKKTNKKKEETIILDNSNDGKDLDNVVEVEEMKIAEMTPVDRNTHTKQRLTVLMDSNRRFIDFKNLFKNKEIVVIPCGSVEVANDILNVRNIDSDEVLLHIGINDLEIKEPPIVSKEIAEVVKRLSDKCSKVFVSMITIRKDHLDKNVEMANALLKLDLQAIENQEIILIDHKSITSNGELYDKKHLSKKWVGNELSGVEKLCLDFLNAVDGSINGTDLVKSIRYKNRYNHERRNQSYNNKRNIQSYSRRTNLPESRYHTNERRNRNNNELYDQRYYTENHNNNKYQDRNTNLMFTNERRRINNYNMEIPNERFVNYFTSCNSNFSTLV